MAEDNYIQAKDDDGHEIHGTYRLYGDTIMVTLSDGTGTRIQLKQTATEADAVRLLRELDRKSRGKSTYL